MSKLNQEELLRLLGMAVQNAIEYFVINKDKEFIEKIPQLQQAHLQIREMIQKPGVTEEWIEEKAIELNNEILLANYKESYYSMSKKFIRSLVEEIRGKQPIERGRNEKI